jgi:ABC-type Fe3+/spermidine/putrescine transport system ATPase subunit
VNLRRRRIPLLVPTLGASVVLALAACGGSTDAPTSGSTATAGSSAGADGDLVIYSGRNEKLVSGLLDRLSARPSDLVVARFVGDLVELAGTRTGATVETALGRLPLCGRAEVPDGPVTAALRPEQIRVEGRLERGGHRAHVDDVVFHGHDSIVRLRLSLSRPAVHLAARSQAPLRPGDEVAVRVIGPALAYAR